MTKEVMVRIVGMHNGEETDNQPVASAAAGVYYLKDGVHYVLFEEHAQGFTETIKNRLKLKGNVLEISKQGLLSSNMVFEEGVVHNTVYNTPYGTFLMGIHTKRFAMEEREDSLRIQVDYTLEMDDKFVAESRIDIMVVSADLPDRMAQQDNNLN